jgi:hypothetical protein
MADILESIIRRLKRLESRVEFIGHLERPGAIGRVQFVAIKGLADNVATSVARITTANEAGDADSGVYAVFAHLLIANTNTMGTTGPSAAKGLTVQFCRAMGNTGTGVNSAVVEVVETASAAIAPAQRDIGAVTVTLLEVSEYVVDVQVQADHTGALGSVLACVMEINLNWYGFLTAPRIGNA